MCFYTVQRRLFLYLKTKKELGPQRRPPFFFFFLSLLISSCFDFSPCSCLCLSSREHEPYFKVKTAFIFVCI